MITLHQALALAAATLAGSAAVVDLQPSVDATALAADIAAERDHITAPELADRIMQRDSTLVIFDLRTHSEYDQFHIPTAQLISIDALAAATLPRSATIVLYSEGGAHAAQGWTLLRLRGYRHVYFLREGLYEWLARVHEPRLADDATGEERAAFARAEGQSRYFGGRAQSGVPRSEIPAGYWTAEGEGNGESSPIRDVLAGIRRRGC